MNAEFIIFDNSTNYRYTIVVKVGYGSSLFGITII